MSRIQKANRLFARRKYENALELFLRHAQDCPADAPTAYARAAKCCLHFNTLKHAKRISKEFDLIFQSDRKTACSLFRKALSIDPVHLESLIGLADVLGVNSDERLAVMEQILVIAPHYMTLINVGDFHRSVRKDLSQAYDFYKSAVEQKPLEGTAYLRLVSLCKRLGREEESKQWQETWNKIYKSKPQVGPSN